MVDFFEDVERCIEVKKISAPNKNLILKNSAGRALTADWSVNSFIMVVYVNIFSVLLRTENSD